MVLSKVEWSLKKVVDNDSLEMKRLIKASESPQVFTAMCDKHDFRPNIIARLCRSFRV